MFRYLYVTILVNGKNLYGGYIGRQPWEYFNGRVLLEVRSYEAACEHAQNPIEFQNRANAEAKRKAKALEKAALEREAKAIRDAQEHEANVARERELLCKQYLEPFVDELKYGIKAPFREQSVEDLDGSILIDGKTVSIQDCDPKFAVKTLPAVNTEAKALFERYCVKNYSYRLRDYSSASSAMHVKEICGLEVSNKAAEDSANFMAMEAEEKKRNADKPGNSQDAIRCSNLQDYMLIGSRATRTYWAMEFNRICQ